MSPVQIFSMDPMRPILDFDKDPYKANRSPDPQARERHYTLRMEERNSNLVFWLESTAPLSSTQQVKYGSESLHALVPENVGDCWITIDLDTTEDTGWNWYFHPQTIMLNDKESAPAANQYFHLTAGPTSLRFYAYKNSSDEQTDRFNLYVMMSQGSREPLLLIVDPDIKNPADP
jgi:hypothetical protein